MRGFYLFLTTDGVVNLPTSCNISESTVIKMAANIIQQRVLIVLLFYENRRSISEKYIIFTG